MCGDEDGAVIAVIGETGLREISRSVQAVDTLRVERGPGGLGVMSLVPALVCVGEDCE
jgi:hypothetical protein